MSWLWWCQIRRGDEQDEDCQAFDIWHLWTDYFATKNHTTSFSEFLKPFFGSSLWFWVVGVVGDFSGPASTLRLLYYHLADAVILLLGEDSDTEDSSSLGTVKPIESAWKHPIVICLKRCVSMRFWYTHHITYTCIYVCRCKYTCIYIYTRTVIGEFVTCILTKPLPLMWSKRWKFQRS